MKGGFLWGIGFVGAAILVFAIARLLGVPWPF